MSNPFETDAMAAGYATSRPPVHPRIIELVRQTLGAGKVRRALDIRCGAGLSTQALLPLADECFGLEPVEAMLNWSAAIAPQAHFVVGAAEALPFRGHSMDLITAAGSLNYAQLELFFPEAARVLTPSGLLAVYDFSPGRSFHGTNRLDEWHRSFTDRYPAADREGRVLNPEILARMDHGFAVKSHAHFEIGLPLTPEFYLNYMMTGTNVAAALRRGVPPDEIRRWCQDTLDPVWEGRPREVLFRGYYACMGLA
jgi:SAM-dependent methyltransferase